MLGLSALSFSAPLVLSALALLPAVYFLLRITPPAPNRKAFPAFALLRALKDDENTARRTPPWLLLLRLLVLALIITGLAGPILNAPVETAGARPVLVVVDNSWAAAADWRARRNAFNEIVETARQSGKTIRIATTAPQPGARKPSFSTDPYAAATAASVFDGLAPSALGPDYAAAAEALEGLSEAQGPFDVRWLSDGLAHEGADDFADTLKTLGALTVLINENVSLVYLPKPSSADSYTVARLGAETSFNGRLIAHARDGRIAAREPVAFKAGETSVDITLSIPIALRNDIAKLTVEGARSAGAVRLIDGRERRALVGIVAGGGAAGETENALLTGAFFIHKALEPSADFIAGDINALTRSDASVIVLDDVGRLRDDDRSALEEWVEAGGVLIRFAGDALAEAVIDKPLSLSPAPLRGGGRAFGGALSWETPQPLGAFADNGPFADLAPPKDVFVRRQVLAQPGGETSAKSWASLADGTPLVTGERRGSGALVLFHITATPEWSDLPLAQIFVDMLERLAALSAIASAPDPDETGPDEASSDAAPVYPAIAFLDGFGALSTPPPGFRGADLAAIDAGASAATPPGVYGASAAPLAVNAVDASDAVKPFNVSGVARAPYTLAPPQRLGGAFFITALLLFALDAFLSWRAGGGRLAAANAAALIAALLITASPMDAAHAQPLDVKITSKQIEAGLETRFAHVATGDAEVDRIAEAGLTALSAELTRRTAVEPAAPHAVNLETDDLTLYPLLYWPILPDAPTPSDAALANLELFMRFGGLVIFDTRDDERAVGGLETPERVALRTILQNIDTPPLRPLPEDHVLKRSFYLLPDLPGRAASGPVWVQASGEANDAVTPLIIGGRDWAGAWARDALGRPLRPIPRGGSRAREFSYRAGVNIAMVALTGNYKSDQVHAPVLLERLGR